ncbi:UNVERIFIED_CONTAM: hypothetical protein GTU68_065636 [Idotea baltica]|nr:hypothetical protein [Idotea baltica]
MPVGAYSYSQGLEWAVENHWINNEETFEQWVLELIDSTLAKQELPLIRRLHRAFINHDIRAVEHWSQTAIAVRDTSELRREELDRAIAYLRVLETIASVDDSWPRDVFLRSSLVSMCYFSVEQHISEDALCRAFAHNWLENTLITGVKIIPLGQSSAQRMLFQLTDRLLKATIVSSNLTDDEVGISLPALSMASCGHEQQYSRVYRS